MRWKLRIPPGCLTRRRSDGTLWTPSGEHTPFFGFNFVRVHKARVGWKIDFDNRWVFFDQRAFDIEN